MKKSLQEKLHMIRREHSQRVEVFKTLLSYEKREVLFSLSKVIQREILMRLDEKELVEFLEYLDPDEATDALQLLSAHKRDRILKALKNNVSENLEVLLKFDPDTAGGLMSLDYIQVESYEPLSYVGKKIHTHEKRTGKMPVVLVMKGGKIIGYLPGRALAFASPKDTALKHKKRIAKVSHHKTRGELIELFRRHPHDKVVVTDGLDSVFGIIYSDDILKLVHEEEAKQLYGFAGVSKQETVYDSTKTKVKFRYKWLILNLATAFLAASVVGLFEDTISRYVLLAIYMPIVAGMGGNAATQTLAVLVRGIALHQIDLKTAMRTLWNEIGSGFINGTLNGIIVAVVVIFTTGEYLIAGILAASMVINLMVAAFFGTLIPLVMQRLGKDPASSATIFITTATDVFGFLAFLGLATILLS